MHLLETSTQRAWLDANYPGGILKFLDSIGFLSPRLTLAHCTWARPDELELIAERGATISVNTSSNLHLRSGIAPLKEMVKRGCRVALGLDGSTLDEDDDALREMRLAHLLHQGIGVHDRCRSRSDAANGVPERPPLGHQQGRRRRARAPASRPISWCSTGTRSTPSGCSADLDPFDLLFARTTMRHIHELIVAGRSVVREGEVLGRSTTRRCATICWRGCAPRMGQNGPLAAALLELERAVADHYLAETPCC